MTSRAPSPSARLADRIVRAIERDFMDRRGLRHQWDAIEPDIQREIRAEWRRIVEEELTKHETDRPAPQPHGEKR